MNRNDHGMTAATTLLTSVGLHITEALIQGATELISASRVTPAHELEAFIVASGCMDSAEFHALLNFGKLLETEKEKFLGSAVSFETIKSLLAAKPRVREAALAMIGRRKTLRFADLEQIEMQDSLGGLPDSERSEHRRAAYLEPLLARTAADRLACLAQEVDRLQNAAFDFSNEFGPWSDDDDFSYDTSLEGYVESYERIKELAAPILSEIYRLLGDPDARESSSVEAVKLAKAVWAVRRFAEGRFAHRGGFGLDESHSQPFSADLQRSLEYLVSSAPADAEKHEGLRVLELCAGAGGMSIGLMSASFKHEALYETNRVRAKTLRQNWPSWKVKHEDFSLLSDGALEKYADIDLLAAGVPCGPGTGSKTIPDLFPELCRVLKQAKPRSFMFEFDAGKRKDSDIGKIGEFLSMAMEEGYRPDRFTLAMSDFGLPINRKRVFIVGIRKDMPGIFQQPTFLDPVSRSVVDLFFPMIAPYETPYEDRHLVPLNSAQRTYDIWAMNWRSTHSRSLLPSYYRGKDGSQYDPESWKKAGFDGSDLKSEVVKIGDPRVENADFKPHINLKVLALSQGFPEEWRFAAEKHGIMSMIADATPPILAKVVALSIRAALTGEAVDLSSVFRDPLIDRSRIGALRGIRSRLFQTHLALAPLREKASRVLAGEELASVEPNHKQRKPIRIMMDRIRTERGDDHDSYEWPEDDLAD